VVVGKARQRKVGGHRLTPMLFGDDMIDLKRKLVIDLGHLAVFTLVASALPDQLTKSYVHGSSNAAVGTLENLTSS
jgi:hypothetical protein